MITRRFIAGGAAVGAIGLLSLTIAGAGIAAAANGGSLILGHSNTATATTTLRDSHGTPLSLVGKASAPPLKVSSAKQVNHLNASLLGGESAAQLATHGSGAQLPDPLTYSEALTTDHSASTKIAATSELSAGTYFVSASAEVRESSTAGDFCFVGKRANATGGLQFSATQSTGDSELGESLVVTLSSPATLGEYCGTNGTGYAYEGGIYAISVAHYTPGSAPSIVRRGGRRIGGH
jgi:hypothetical protein